MKKSISVIASAVILGGVLLTGCGSSSSGTTDPVVNPDANDKGLITIKNATGIKEKIDPTVGGTVIVRSGDRETGEADSVACVVRADLNECTNASSSTTCGPKAGVTYVFQSYFSKLGPIDNDPATADGGVELTTANTWIDGVLHQTPLGGNQETNRIEKVFIPTNYIVLNDTIKNGTTDEKYDHMREYLANICNMKCMFNEWDTVQGNSSNAEPFFTATKTEGKFVATYVMHFSRGISEENLYKEFDAGNKDNLEYLAVSFELDVKKDNEGQLTFSTPAGTPVSFYGKKHGANALQVDSTNIELNSIGHEMGQTMPGQAVVVNMAKYFDKLIAKGEANAISDYAKEILVENATNPWPVKIYGTLHEITDTGYDRSFVKNPALLDAKLFGLDQAGAYKDAFNADDSDNDATNGNDKKAKAQKFVIVYPGGNYNKL